MQCNFSFPPAILSITDQRSGPEAKKNPKANGHSTKYQGGPFLQTSQPSDRGFSRLTLEHLLEMIQVSEANEIRTPSTSTAEASLNQESAPCCSGGAARRSAGRYERLAEAGGYLAQERGCVHMWSRQRELSEEGPGTVPVCPCMHATANATLLQKKKKN